MSQLNRSALLVFSGIGAGTMLLGIHKVAIAIPSIERQLQPGPVAIQLVSAAYVVCFAVTLIPAGRFGDRGHRVTLIYGGLALYLTSALVCSLAVNAWMLVSGRALAGISAGILMPQLMGLVQQLFEKSERGKAFGTYGMCISLATAMGPTVGGLLITLGGDTHGWRGIFLLDVPIAVGLSVAALRLLPPVVKAGVAKPRSTDRIDVIGLVTGTAALVCILVPFIFTTGRPTDVDARWLLFIPAALLAVAFLSHSRRRASSGRPALIDAELLKIRSYRNGVLVSLTWFAAGPAFILGLTIYLQEGLDFSPFLAGVVMLPAAIASATGAKVGGHYVLKLGRLLTGTGMLLVLTSMLTTLLVIHTLPRPGVIVLIPLIQLVSGFGGGLVVSPNHTMTLMEVPADKGSAASALGQLGQRTSNSIGVAVASMAYYSSIYGAGFSLPTASRELHLDAFARTGLVAIGFLALALLVVISDRRRQVQEQREADVDELLASR